MTARRYGDVPKLLANVDKATNNLGWKATKNLEDMCRDSIKFIQQRQAAQSKWFILLISDKYDDSDVYRCYSVE